MAEDLVGYSLTLTGLSFRSFFFLEQISLDVFSESNIHFSSIFQLYASSSTYCTHQNNERFKIEIISAKVLNMLKETHFFFSSAFGVHYLGKIFQKL